MWVCFYEGWPVPSQTVGHDPGREAAEEHQSIVQKRGK